MRPAELCSQLLVGGCHGSGHEWCFLPIWSRAGAGPLPRNPQKQPLLLQLSLCSVGDRAGMGQKLSKKKIYFAFGTVSQLLLPVLQAPKMSLFGLCLCCVLQSLRRDGAEGAAL